MTESTGYRLIDFENLSHPKDLFELRRKEWNE